MRDDLLDAQASIDWAVSNFPAFKERLNSFVKGNLDIILEDNESNSAYYSLVVIEKSPLPLAFNVEAGAYINAIRSSLDILATALAYRYDMPRPDKVYFPIVDSAADFASGKYKGVKFVDGLPAPERTIIESLKPYRGSDGNDRLTLLHDLDIERKHRRLLIFHPTPRKLGIAKRYITSGMFVFNSPGFIRMANKTEIGKLAKGAPIPQIELHAYVAFDEALFPKGQRVIAALDDFASLASSIIKLFDEP
jgi:hypothetical protein